MMRAYLDHAATAPVLDIVRAAMLEAMSVPGNPSSLHSSGRRARRLVEESREAIAGALGLLPAEVVFTGGGTEADNLAVKGLWWSRTAEDPARRRVLASPVEHHAVLDAVHWLGEHEGAQVVWLQVDGLGRVDPEQVRRELAEHPGEVALVAVMWANNEVGTVQPIAQIADACAEAGVPLHSDAVQAVGSIPVDLHLPASAALSAHKLGGPMGVGVLAARRDLALTPLLHGGGQERSVRSGTVDVASIAGCAAAVVHALTDLPVASARLAARRDALLAGIRVLVPDVVVNGALGGLDARLPGNLHLSLPGCEGDALLMLLDAAGIDVSTGSACTAGVPEPSHVLLAMGVDPVLARSSMRISLGRSTADAELEAFLGALPAVVERARAAGHLGVAGAVRS